MRRLFALLIVFCLWVGFAAPASAGEVAGLVPCKDSPAFIQRAKAAKTEAAQRRFKAYADSQVLCGAEGLPHLVVDGRLDHAGEFLIPGVLFLYIAGWIGWVGRAYLQKAKKSDAPEEKEIIIDVPSALPLMISGFSWPLLALKELTTGELTAKDNEIPVSPR